MSALKPIFFSDMDDTLSNSKRKLVGKAHFVASVDRENNPNCFLNEKQENFFNWLNETTELILITARSSRNVLGRVKLPFKSYMIASHGAIIFDKNRNVDEEFKLFILDSYKENESIYEAIEHKLRKLLSSYLDAGVIKYKPLEELGLDLIHPFKATDSANEELLAEIDMKISESKIFDDNLFYKHANGNNLAYLPNFVNKKVAMQFLIDNKLADVEKRAVLGAGDSMTDLPFMLHSDFLVVPKKSQIINNTF